MEHRWGKRIEVAVPVLLLRDGAPPQRGWIENLSASGALIETDPVPYRHGLLDLEIDGMRLAASIVRAMRSRIAVEFCEFASPAILAALQDSRLCHARRLGPWPHRTRLSPPDEDPRPLL